MPSGTTSGMRSVHSGGLSQASRRSVRRLAARAMASACGRMRGRQIGRDRRAAVEQASVRWCAVSAGRQAGGEREGLEAGGRGVARAVFERGAQAQRPEFVEAAVQQAEGGVVGASHDDNQRCSGTTSRRQPDEEAMLGDSGCRDVARQFAKADAHLRTRRARTATNLAFGVRSPALVWNAIGLTCADVRKRRLVQCGLASLHSRTEVDDPLSADRAARCRAPLAEV